MNLRRRQQGDDGVTLVLVLILVAVVAVTMGSTMGLVNSGLLTTRHLDDRATTDYGTDGAAQVAINQLKNSPSSCTGTTVQYSPGIPASGSASAATVAYRCTPDTGNTGSSGGGANSSPGSAILTLSTGSGGERGIYVNSSNNQSTKVHGGIFSNSTIFLEGNKSNLENTNTTNSYVYSMGACSSSGTSVIISTPAAICSYSTNPVSSSDRRGKDPGTISGHGASFDAPGAPTANGSFLPATCSTAKSVFEFQPGLYRSAAALNAITAASGNPCAGSVFHFNPGVYYFDFTDAGSHQWVVNNGFLVGGAANVSGALTWAKISALNGTTTPFCTIPTVTGTDTTKGVEFVFGGDSRFYATKGTNNNNPNVQICASNSTSGPPIAFYGLKTSIGSGAFQVAAETANDTTSCITNPGYATEGGDATHCPILQTTNDPNPALTIYGTTYVPNAVIDLYLNNNTVQVFRWGLVARSVLIGSTGSSGLGSAVIDVPDDAPAPFALPSNYYIDVYVCPGSSSPCGTSGTLSIRTKVQLSVSTPTTASVLSWSHQS